MNTSHLRFLLRRLLLATPAEWLHRAKEQAFWAALNRWPGIFRLLTDTLDVPPNAVNRLRMPAIIEQPDTCGSCHQNHAQEALSAFETRWRSTPTGKVRIVAGDPDMRAVWEPARLQQAVVLMHAENDMESAGRIVSDWAHNSPFLFGPHYLSAMECGLRIPVLLRALNVLAFTDDDRALLLRHLFEHGWLIRHKLSLYSSLGNHTVAEGVGLVMAGALFAEQPQARDWLPTGLRLLLQESSHQILNDGGPAEQSFAYHRFVLDLYWLAVRFLELNRIKDCSELKSRLALGEAFLEDMPSGVGDSDDGSAIAPGLAPERGAPSGIRPISHAGMSVRSHQTSGYTLVRTAGDIRLLFDHGPLGMPPLFNHGHADALSVLLDCKEQPFFVDSGTYRYNGTPEWRRYFKGTSAHNTVSIDGSDQSRQLTSFIWDKPYTTHFQLCKEADRIVMLASHDGYTSLREPVIHQRKVTVWPDGFCLIRDRFTGRGRHRFDCAFHLHPEVVARPEGRWWLLQNGPAQIYLYAPGQLSAVRGSLEPRLGWFSPAYGVLQQTTTLLRSQVDQVDAIEFLTAIAPYRPEDTLLHERIQQHDDPL